MKEIVDFLEIIFQFSIQFGILQTIVILVLLIVSLVIIKPLGNKLLNFIYKWLSTRQEQEHIDSLNYRKNHILTINSILEDLRNYFHCDRAMIFEFHNGGSNLSGLSFQHMSVTFERNALCEYPIANDFQKLALSLFPNLIKDLEETDCLYLNIGEKELEYQSFCKVLKKENIVDSVIIPIYGIEYPLGFILLGSKDPKVLQESDKPELHKQAQRISNLLDYKKHLLKK